MKKKRERKEKKSSVYINMKLCGYEREHFNQWITNIRDSSHVDGIDKTRAPLHPVHINFERKLNKNNHNDQSNRCMQGHITTKIINRPMPLFPPNLLLYLASKRTTKSSLKCNNLRPFPSHTLPKITRITIIIIIISKINNQLWMKTKESYTSETLLRMNLIEMTLVSYCETSIFVV